MHWMLGLMTVPPRGREIFGIAAMATAKYKYYYSYEGITTFPYFLGSKHEVEDLSQGGIHKFY